MFSIRNIKLSVHKKISDMFTDCPNNPDTGTPYLGTKYNVYGEDEYGASGFAPVNPYVFLLMTKVAPQRTRLPALFLDFGDFNNAPYEIGTLRGGVQVCMVHVYGRNRGERDDLAGFVRQVLTDHISLVIYDFTPTVKTTLHTTQIEGVSVTPQSVGDDLGLEGTLNNWNIVSFGYQIRA